MNGNKRRRSGAPGLRQNAFPLPGAGGAGLRARLIDAIFNAHDAFKRCFYAHRWLQLLMLALASAFFAWSLFASGTLPL